MAYTPFPADLPNPEGTSDFSWTPRNNIVASSPDTGPPKTRRRSTFQVADVVVKLVLTQAQVAELETFYWTTLASALPFSWMDFRKVGFPAQNYKFMQPPDSVYRDNEVNMFDATLTLVTVP